MWEFDGTKLNYKNDWEGRGMNKLIEVMFQYEQAFAHLS